MSRRARTTHKAMESWSDSREASSRNASDRLRRGRWTKPEHGLMPLLSITTTSEYTARLAISRQPTCLPDAPRKSMTAGIGNWNWLDSAAKPDDKPPRNRLFQSQLEVKTKRSTWRIGLCWGATRAPRRLAKSEVEADWTQPASFCF